MRIFLDTNFVIDYLFRKEYKPVAEDFLSFGRQRKYKFYISYLSVANVAYIARKIPKEELYSGIHEVLKLFRIIPNDKKQIEKALELKASDFEDALQYAAAIEAKCDFIITRNHSDFKFSTIPVRSAGEYISEFFSPS